MDELRDLVELIAEHGFTDFELEREGFRVRLGRALPQPVSTQNVPASSSQATAQQTPSASQPAGSETQSSGGASSSSSAATSATGEQAATPAATPPSEDEGLHIITSPIVGTFYRSPSPTAEPFVRIGSHIHADSVVCIIEAMKLMNEIQAETSGEVVKIYVENGQPVEYGQPLFGIKK